MGVDQLPEVLVLLQHSLVDSLVGTRLVELVTEPLVLLLEPSDGRGLLPESVDLVAQLLVLLLQGRELVGGTAQPRGGSRAWRHRPEPRRPDGEDGRSAP